MPDALLIRLGIDTQELQDDLERVANGELELPTVSALKMIVNGKAVEQVPVYLDEETFDD
jgi:uncharacterized protein (DUF111 family)